MKIVNKKLTDGSWVKYPKDKSVELKIRPLSIYDFNRLPSEGSEITAEEFGAFMSKLVLAWKGIKDENGKDFKCDEENKKFLADHDQDLASFVITTATELKGAVVSDEEVKN